MKKYCVRIIALALSTVVIVSTFPTSLYSRVITAQAVPKNVNQDYSSTNNSQKSSELKSFTSTEDLVAAMKAELLLKDDSNTVDEKEKQQLQVLSDTIEKKCGYTLTEVKSLLAINIFQERNQDKVDVSKYNLSKDEITTIIDLVLKDYCATDIIDVSVNADENGNAQTISVYMNRGFESGLDALDEMDGVGEIYPATENLEEKETTTTSSYIRSAQTAQSTTSLDETTEISMVTPKVIGDEVETATPGAIDGETHTYGDPTFTWSEININEEIPYTCTAKFTCSECNQETTLDCTVTRDEEQTSAIIYIATCGFEDKEYSTTRDATTEQLYAHWGELCTFYGKNGEYYGISAEYWTSKTTENNPFGALKVLAGFDLDTEVPAPNMDELIAGITQAFGAYVYYYGDALLAARDEALKGIDDSMTDLQKCLVLHDYLATHAVFDMSTLLNYQNEQKESDPITMTPFGALLYGKIDGLNGCVCLGYASTYTYLIQSAFPEIYKDENNTFKSYEEVLDSGQDMVDFVMIKYDCDVKEVGVTHGEGGLEGRFNEPHYYNVVKLDGKWYNVDVCYDDIKTETLTQYRVESDGNLSHMYFLVSEDTIKDWYDGYYEYIDTLHGTDSAEPCNSDQYEDAWFSNIDCPISHDDEYWYFVESQFSDRDMMDNEDGNSSQFGDILSNMDNEQMAEMMKDYGDQMKIRPRAAGDLSEEEGTVLLDYGKGDITNLNTNETTEGVLEEECDDDIHINNIYPDLTHSLSLYNDTLYFNLDNKIYMYNLEDGSVTQLKEYNKVYAYSNGTPFTGSSFYITNAQDENLKYTINNHPLAALCIKDDGIMYVSVATNYSNSECSKYEKESVNFNARYNRFAKDNSEDDNDNSEFMWCANVKDNINMSDVATYLSDGTKRENVVVDPWCDKQGYTEGRDVTHGFSSGAKKTDFTDAKAHHYIFIDEEGCYICGRCYKELDTEDAKEQGIITGHTYGEPVFSWEELEGGGYKCTATFTCECEDDVQTIDATVTSKEEIAPGDSDCNKEKNTVYTATCEFDGKTYTDTKATGAEQVVIHTYGDPKFNWGELEDGGYKCTATFTCKYGDDVQTIDATVTSKEELTAVDTECHKERKTVYTATCEIEGKTYTDTKTVVLETIVDHTYGDPEFSWIGNTERGYTCDAIFTCKDCKDQQKVTCNVTSQSKDGAIIYTATCNFNNKTYNSTKTVQVSTQPSVPVVTQPQVPITVSKPITNLEILKSDIKLTKNKSISLELQITPSDTTETELQFTSSNDTIATVTNKGIVTGHQTGTAIITVSTVDGRLTKKVNVEVGEPVTSIELNQTKLNLVKKETSLLSATITPDNAIIKEVQFISQDESVATVDSNGKVTAVGIGTTQIIVKSMDGSDITAKCLVTVKQKVTKLSISSIAAQTFTGRVVKPKVIIKDGTYQLQYGKDYSLKWKNNTNVGTAEITVVGKGNYTGTKKIYFIIKPSKVSLSSVKNTKSTAAVATWKSMKGVSGYQVFYATSEKGAYKAAGTTSKTSFTITKLKSNSTVYVKVRAYKKIDGKNVYGAYSKVIKVKVK